MDSHESSKSGGNSSPSPVQGPASKAKGNAKGSSGRKNVKWGRHEHRVFISYCEEAIVASYREGKCFTTARWELIVGWLKERTGRERSQAALLNHRNSMRKDHKQLFKLLNSSGVTYDQIINAVVAPDH